MECFNCGYKNQEGAKYCKSCGSALRILNEKPKNRCSACGYELLNKNLFCTHCGLPNPSFEEAKTSNINNRNLEQSPVFNQNNAVLNQNTVAQPKLRKTKPVLVVFLVLAIVVFILIIPLTLSKFLHSKNIDKTAKMSEVSEVYEETAKPEEESDLPAKESLVPATDAPTVYYDKTTPPQNKDLQSEIENFLNSYLNMWAAAVNENYFYYVEPYLLANSEFYFTQQRVCTALFDAGIYETFVRVDVYNVSLLENGNYKVESTEIFDIKEEGITKRKSFSWTYIISDYNGYKIIELY